MAAATLTQTTATTKLNDQCRLVVPKEIRQALGVTAGDQIIFTLKGNNEVSLTSPQAIRRTVWANNHGGDAGDSTLDIRAQRIADQDVEQASQEAIEADEQAGESAEEITTDDLLAQLA